MSIIIERDADKILEQAQLENKLVFTVSQKKLSDLFRKQATTSDREIRLDEHFYAALEGPTGKKRWKLHFVQNGQAVAFSQSTDSMGQKGQGITKTEILNFLIRQKQQHVISSSRRNGVLMVLDEPAVSDHGGSTVFPPSVVAP